MNFKRTLFSLKTSHQIRQQALLLTLLSLSMLLLSACGTTTNVTTLPELPKQEEAIPAEKVELPAEVPTTVAKTVLPQIISFKSSHYAVPSAQKVRLEFVTNNADALELSYNNKIINVKQQPSIEIDISQSTTFNLHALNAQGRQSSSLSVRVANTPFILQAQDVLRLRATDGNKRLRLDSNIPDGYELVVMGLSEIGNSKAQTLNVIQQRGLVADTANTALSTQSVTESVAGSQTIEKPQTALFLEDSFSTRPTQTQSLQTQSLQTQALQTQSLQTQAVLPQCNYTVGAVCSFFVLAFDTKVNQTFLDIRKFELVSNVNGINFFVDTADLVSNNPDIDAISKETIDHLGNCASAVAKRHFNPAFATKTDIDNSGGISLLMSDVLPYNGMVRWDDLDRNATGENNRADVAYLNTKHMKGLSPLSIATLYEEMFHAHHLGYRAANGLARPDRFEAESVIGAVLDNIRQDKGISSTCGGGAKDTSSSIEVAAGHFTLANIFLNKSYKRSLFSEESVSLQMAQYGIGRLLSSTMNYRDSSFIRKVITSKNTHHKTWSSLTDSSRVFEDAWLSLFLADSPDHAGYNLSKNHYTRLDTDYNILGTVKGLSLTNLGQEQANESLIMLTGQATQANTVVNLNLDFDSGSVVAFLRLKK